jgi:hypothetical protein
MPGGRVFIVDQHHGLLSSLIFSYLHHEPYLPEAEEWSFTSSGPLSGANGALSWIVFRRDLARFEWLFKRLKIVGYTPHTPLQYWIAGGLKSWSLCPLSQVPRLRDLDRTLLRLTPNLGSFADIEIVKC